MKRILWLIVMGIAVLAITKEGPSEKNNERFWITVEAQTREERTAIGNLGLAIEEINADSISGSCDQSVVAAIKQGGFTITRKASLDWFLEAFPPADAPYHDYSETKAELQSLARDNPKLISLFSAGVSHEGRELWVTRFNTTEKENQPSAKPGVIFMGTHHAREHLSTEIPLLLARHLAAQYNSDSKIRALLNNRDVFIVPIVNPDGVEYDIETSSYRMWRKNRKTNSSGSYGVDLNRNYSYKWGGGGSSSWTGSDIYRGEAPFSEPETKAMKDFIEKHKNIKVLLSYHTFSELILYPWGHTYDPIDISRDRAVFEALAKTMAQWTGYKNQQSSQLYIASGDTTDWAYGVHKIFAFTFELTPKSLWQGGFYPGAGVIQSTWKANARSAMYLIEIADNPYKVLPPSMAFRQKSNTRLNYSIKQRQALTAIFDKARPR